MRHPRLLRFAALASAVAMLVPAQLLTAKAAGAAGDTSFAVDLGTGAAPIPNLFSNMVFFHYKSTWNTDTIEAKPANYVKATYPWLRTARLQYATGGCYEPYPNCLHDRDMFVNDAQGPSSGYDFFPIHRAARNILRQGLKPYIDLGAVPVTMSNPPFIGFYFHINTRPPSDYQAYHDYLWWMLQSLVSEFGINEVRTWHWSVISEFENGASFQTADQNPLNTQNAYFKLYDYSVGALEEVLGALRQRRCPVHVRDPGHVGRAQPPQPRGAGPEPLQRRLEHPARLRDGLLLREQVGRAGEPVEPRRHHRGHA